MSLRYALLDPTGNTTVLVESPVPPEQQPIVAAELMAQEPMAEQVGFVSPGGEADISLRMAGGEFCGNATMSAAALRFWEKGMSDGIVRVAASGASEPVSVAMKAIPDGGLRGTVDMPRPISMKVERFPGGSEHPVVRFDGIAHVILEEAMDRAEAEALAPVWCGHLGADAVGLMLLDRAAGTLAPLVYVPAANTLCWENSCASGTTAAGAYLASVTGGGSFSLRQPGGTLRVDAIPDGSLRLTGTVRLLHRGQK